MPETPVFRIAGLRFAYGPTPVLLGLDLELMPGRFYGIVGPNGCGKTTLLDLMVGTRPPASGVIAFMGRGLEDYTRRALAKSLALVPQEMPMGFPFTVRETVLMGRHPHIPRFAAPSETDLAKVEQALAQLELTALADKLVPELSGGERQRVVLARALAQDTPVLLMDEPTSHLDISHALAVLRVAEDLVREQGRTVVAVMHDLNLAAAFCDHLVFIKQGRLHAAGPTVEVLQSGSLQEVFGVKAKVGWDDFAGSRVVIFQKPGGLT
ncbi:MAG: ABC transporter ATP-binding protein [Desulfarculus sp.]|nr:ABC transporter ATP-binding protein [Desulfarculus sp.]